MNISVVCLKILEISFLCQKCLPFPTYTLLPKNIWNKQKYCWKFLPLISSCWIQMYILSVLASKIIWSLVSNRMQLTTYAVLWLRNKTVSHFYFVYDHVFTTSCCSNGGSKSASVQNSTLECIVFLHILTEGLWLCPINLHYCIVLWVLRRCAVCYRLGNQNLFCMHIYSYCER